MTSRTCCGTTHFCQSCIEKDKEIDVLKHRLKKAVEYLVDGKRRFRPNTTNSVVDSFIADYYAREKGVDE
jgi:iron-sulfur cluster repair protein YtfE (RIC family)